MGYEGYHSPQTLGTHGAIPPLHFMQCCLVLTWAKFSSIGHSEEVSSYILICEKECQSAMLLQGQTLLHVYNTDKSSKYVAIESFAQFPGNRTVTKYTYIQYEA
jgi:hypothetical protein